ncbi:MAG: hypothetical protein JF588_06875 [Caulobacterales bacterium]|nr:hypothetical protein [Caulobacterales bacterium]
MSRRAQVFEVENRLAKIVSAPGGRTVDQAVKAAETRIEAVREVSLASLVGKSDQMVQVAAAARRGEQAKPFDAIYDISNAIYGLASSFGLTALSEAAFSLCDLADGFRTGEEPSWPAIDVHVDGVRLLSMLGAGVSAADAESILDGLRRVRARVLPST